MTSAVKPSYALVEMPWISASQEYMQGCANETDNIVAKLFYRYVGLTLTAMEGVDKAACAGAEAVYDTPGTGSMMAWSMRGLEVIALATVITISVSLAITIITTAIVFATVFGAIALFFIASGGSVGHFLQGMKDILLENAEVTEMNENKELPENYPDSNLQKATAGLLLETADVTSLISSDNSGSGDHDGEPQKTAAQFEDPWASSMNPTCERQQRTFTYPIIEENPFAAAKESNSLVDLMNAKMDGLVNLDPFRTFAVGIDPWAH